MRPQHEEVAFALLVEQLDPVEVALRHHEVCQHGPEDVLAILGEWRAACQSNGAPPVAGVPGLRYLGRGCDKVVYELACGRHVLKLDLGQHEYGNQLRREVEIWEESEEFPEVRALLCPVDAHGDDWIVARRASTDGAGEALDWLTWNAPCHLPDLKRANVGWLGRRPVLIDYGYGPGGSLQDWIEREPDDPEPDPSAEVFNPCQCAGCRAARGEDEPAAFELAGVAFIAVS